MFRTLHFEGTRERYMWGSHRNITSATVAGLSELLKSGQEVEVRGSLVRELRNHVTRLERPQERCLFIPHRKNDVIATVAETLWMIAGRDDTHWLSHYLPRAAEFSDDAVTWRGAYGPRLRNWNGTDQIAECLRLLLSEAHSRRAVMSLYDPVRDFSTSKDIPCNNWLNWLQRDGQLHLTVGVRSNDVIWGFSGINSFEWSVLQQMMSFWMGIEPGDVTYLATSFHVYERHYERARQMLEGFRAITCYDYGLMTPAFTIPFEQLDLALSEWFFLEAELRSDPEKTFPSNILQSDPLLSVSLELMRLHQGIARGWSENEVKKVLQGMPVCDLTAAAYESCSRRFPAVLDGVPNESIAAFLQDYTKAVLPSGEIQRDHDSLPQGIKHLHAIKDAAYGNAWKKRGELTSILANVARKIDRLQQYNLTQTSLADESLTDTAIDLFVYLLKHRLYLQEQLPAICSEENTFSVHVTPLSDQVSAFDALVDSYHPVDDSSFVLRTIVEEIIESFEVLHTLASTGASLSARLEANERLSALVWILVVALDRRV